MAAHLLSKSSFLKGLQCHKALYLYKNFIHFKDPVPAERRAVFNRGHEVGFLARSLFPEGVDASPSKISEFDKSVEKTKKLISEGTKAIYEASFVSNEVLVALDILSKTEDKKWIAWEVKSSLKISSNYILDAALQYWVIKNSGIDLEDFYLINLNSAYVRNKTLEIEKLFSRTSIINEILKKQVFIEENINTMKKMLMDGKIPGIAAGSHCNKPYDCDFLGYCGANQEMKTENKFMIDKGRMKGFLKTLKYPIQFTDFEVMMPAVPLYENTSPFQNIPFQYSILSHNDEFSSQGEKNKKQFSFLAEPGPDPRKEFLENYLRDSSGDGTILVYDALMEKSILNSLKKMFPEYKKEIDQRTGRIKDLIQPFKNGTIRFGNNENISLKNISNLMLTSGKFEDLKINNGRSSMTAYENLLKENDLFKMMETREALELYCKTDTEAMAGILDVMRGLVRLEQSL